MTDYEFRMFIENLQSNVTFLQDAAEDLYDDLDELDLENRNDTDILEILLQFVRIGYLTEKIFKTSPVIERFLLRFGDWKCRNRVGNVWQI